MDPKRDFAPVEAVLRAIKPDLDAATLVGIRTLLDPDRHRDVVLAANARDEKAELEVLRQAINSVAYVRLRHQAARHGIRLPSPAQLKPLLDEVAESKPVRRRRGRIEPKVAQSYAHAVAGVYYAITWKVKTTNLGRSPNTEWGRFAKAAFEYAGLMQNWAGHARDAARELRRHLKGDKTPKNCRKNPPK